MKKLIDFTVTQNIELQNEFHILSLKSHEELETIHPGQFVEIKVDRTPETFLRRPFSVNGVDYDKKEIYVLIQKVGAGSRALCEVTHGDLVNVMYPLGKGFSNPPQKQNRILLIGGGCGSAPLLFFGKKLKKLGFQPSFLIGARSESYLLFREEYAELGVVYLTTESGNCGERGYVTNHSCLNEKWDCIYTCGPEAMMKAVAKYAKNNNIFCEVSLENTMACGIGACLCCVVDTTLGHKCACTEGPVFNINDLKWDF